MRRCEVEAGVEGFTEVEDSHEDQSSLIRPLSAAVTPAAPVGVTLTPRTTKSTAVAMEQHRNFEGPRGERAEAEII